MFASLNPDQQLDTITFEEAELFQLPKDLGEYEGEVVSVNNGRYGPYVKFGTTVLPKGQNPMDVDCDGH